MLNYLKIQLQQVREGGIVFFIRKMLRLLLLIIHTSWALPALLLIRAFRPFLLIRFGRLDSLAMGHFAIDAAEQLKRMQIQPVNTVDWFWIETQIPNVQWGKMVCRNLPVYPWVYYLYRWNQILPGGQKNFRPSSFTKSRDTEGLLQKHGGWFFSPG